MAITYKDTRRQEKSQGRSGPVLAVIVVIGGLLWFAPQTTAMVENVLSTMLALPRF